jgi:hypothetical protein
MTVSSLGSAPSATANSPGSNPPSPATALERLNYFNGQRLQAGDFRLEQEYHIQVRRWLNKSLYTWGIAAGLQVTVKEGDAHKVVVGPGMALDTEGREIILLEGREIQVAGTPSPVAGIVFGNYLVIQYAEEKVAPVVDGCATPLKDKSSQKLAWGGPSRIRSEPVISWQSNWPNQNSGKIVLAQVELDEMCAVRAIHLAVRKYAGEARPPKTLAYALEGEKDIDEHNSKKIYFHIRGGRPETVTLYLRAAPFSSLYYTELGRHTHALDIEVKSHSPIEGHSHSLGEIKTSFVDPPAHIVTGDIDEDPAEADNVLMVDDTKAWKANLTAKVNLSVVHDKGHEHLIAAGQQTSVGGAIAAQSHAVTGSIAHTGLNPAARTAGSSFSYVADLRILLDKKDYTATILDRLEWTQLGNGTANHPIVQDGTGPIQLELLGMDLNEREHCLELKVTSGGGRILYNLYVE